MRVTHNRKTNEALAAFFYENQMLFSLHARGDEITATFYADNKIRERLAHDEAIEKAVRDQVKRRPWAAFSIHSLKDFLPFLGLVRAKYHLISEDKRGQSQMVQVQPIAI